MADLCWIVPTRGRPANLAAVLAAIHTTGGFGDVHVLAAIDADDPCRLDYDQVIADWPGTVSAYVIAQWTPMVSKLNAAALEVAPDYFAVGFGGDDHLPRSNGWARRFLAHLHQLGTGIVYGNDLLQGAKLPTHWAMTSDIVHALGRMVPADVDHLYCDNAVGAIGQAAGCLRYLPDVIVEHMHPIAGKAQPDAGYETVNSAERYADDGRRFQQWATESLASDADILRALRLSGG